MSELSDDARDLARTLAGLGCTYRDGALQSAHSWNPSRYERADFLRIAQAALELSGESVEFEDKGDECGFRSRYYVLDGFRIATITQLGRSSDWSAPMLTFDIAPELDRFALEPTFATKLAAILLHAAATAREWASESEGK